MEKNKNTWLWIIPIGIVILLFLFGGFRMGYGMMGFGMGYGFIFMLLFWGVIIWIIVTLINSQSDKKESEDPLTILKKRYASGEITKKQYEEMRKELNR